MSNRFKIPIETVYSNILKLELGIKWRYAKLLCMTSESWIFLFIDSNIEAADAYCAKKNFKTILLS